MLARLAFFLSLLHAPTAKKKAREKGEFMAERRYIEDSRIVEPEQLEAGGIDMSGRFGLLVTPRTIPDFDHSLFQEVRKEPAGKFVHRCFQCGNCTAACPVAEENPMFNPRYIIHVVRMGYERELEKVRKYVFLCASCGRCSEVCPRDVDPSGVMAAIGTVVRKAWR